MILRSVLLLGLMAGPAFGQAPNVKPQTKFINEQLAAIWKNNNIQASARCKDSEFVRRVYLDLIGRIPLPAEVQAFLASGANRPKLVSDLLTDKKYAGEFASHMADVWTVWLLTRSGNGIYHQQMKLWLEQQFENNASYKDIVTQLITAKGKTSDNGAVNFILSHLGERTANGKQMEEGHFEMVPITSRTTRLFLGLQTQCVQCHDHPFNPEWKQQAFWGVNVFYRQVDRAGNPIMRQNNRNELAAVLELKDDDAANKDSIVYYERRNGMILPTSLTFLDGRKAEVTSKTRREILADLIVTHDNFPKAIVNRMWGMLMGRGMNEQPVVDDFGEHNKVVHEELLNKLAKDFAYANYDLKELLDWICCSDVYSLSSKFNEKGTNAKPETDIFFCRMLLKAMTPEQLLNSLWVATHGEKPNEEKGDTKEKEKRREDWTKKLVANFGDDEGNEVNFNGTVVQALLMMNGPEINKEIAATNGTLFKSTRDHKNNFNKVVNDIYMTTLSRGPSDAERTAIRKVADKYGGKIDQTYFTDVMWAVLNSNEFILNH